VSTAFDYIDDRRAVVQPVSKFWYKNKVSALDVLRLDLLHPVVSGNKWFKLRLNILHALDNNMDTLVTFGGGYSNHLVATAFAARKAGLKSVGIVRGRYDVLTPSLLQCTDYGMELIFVTREDYNNKHQPDWAQQLVAHFDNTFFIPEGGDNERGRAGAGLLDRFIAKDYTHIAVAVGSGTTLAGIRQKIPASQHVIGFVPMKGGCYLKEHIAAHLSPGQNVNWELTDKWHFGGFGKWNTELVAFMNDFYRETSIPLDIVYTGKMLFGLSTMLEELQFSSCDKILVIHSGGLQGNCAVNGLIY
jgi:1-aminocyclopropane-1-carboxylate deaminase